MTIHTEIRKEVSVDLKPKTPLAPQNIGLKNKTPNYSRRDTMDILLEKYRKLTKTTSADTTARGDQVTDTERESST